MKLKFKVSETARFPPCTNPDVLYLITDKWDDYGVRRLARV